MTQTLFNTSLNRAISVVEVILTPNSAIDLERLVYDAVQ